MDKITTFAALRANVGWKLESFAMLFGMGKQHINRIERGRRKETLTHQETISLVYFLHQKGLLEEYVEWRFGFPISNKHKK